ncbi:MAG: 4-hydroxy-3-methylbut-2-enyl diphosphate reductase [Deltaproteobacteria bacterium HGW-Deltaproteobacteria-2]|jgi:4-hydroxy-3-methylbut-2-enyl diphosphate reductase|nr:MAG: 4-hydroxy-3-methylbut-2-enyl diphosphate reductase [Deltaproteobacteria bacterium HGW-Deltaproteobacteria-2]
MEIKLAKTAGFCMGVRRAVDIVLDIAQHETSRRIYTYGPLIHNPQTIELLKNRGVKPIENIEEIKDKENAILIIRAHGIAPAERKKIKESGIKIVDATCPKVGYVQSIIKKHAALDYTVVIVGDKEHPEVDGLLGYTGGRGIIISSLDEVDELSSIDKVCVVAQTTQDSENYSKIVEKIKNAYPHAIVFNTICSSTEKRQAEVIAMASEMDAMFIVGGKNSANTRRLADLAQKQQTPSFHIETPAEMENINFIPYNRIGVSAGASTPNWIIDRVMDKIMEGQSRKLKSIGTLLNLWISAIKTDVYSALGAGCLCLACMLLQKIPVTLSSIAIASFFVYAMHVLNRLLSRKPAGLVGSFREESYYRYGKLYFFTALFSIAVALTLALKNAVIPFIFLFVISLAGVIYNIRILPKKWHFRSLKDLPGSKNIFMSAAWGIVAAILPALNRDFSFHAGLIVAFVFTFGIVFIRSAMSDILEIQSDKLIGQETIPVFFGRKRTITILRIISLILLVLLLFSYLVDWTSALSIFLLACILYIWICFRFCDRESALSGAVKEGLLETSYIMAGFCVLLWYIF